MKKFIITALLFLSPIIISAVVMEMLLQKIPNDYRYKRSYLDKHSNSISVLVLGSSHSYYGINPSFMRDKSFNAAYVSQSLYYDWQIVKKYENNWRSLKFIVIPVDYFSLYGKLENTVERWRIKNYINYYGIGHNNLIEGSELLNNKLRLNMGRIKSNYLDHDSDISCSKLGWGFEYTFQKKQDLPTTGILAAERHTAEHLNRYYFEENIENLRSIIKYAAKNHIKVLLYTSPAYKSYVKNLKPFQLNTTVNALQEMSRQYDNVFYFNLLNDQSFNNFDFYDADHLDNRGARKFSVKIDSLLSSIDHGKSSHFSSRLTSYSSSR